MSTLSKISTRALLTPKVQVEPSSDPVESARTAGLRYSNDATPGIRRVRCGRGFRYLDPDGRAVRDAETLRRIQAVVIPPAWTGVWICPQAHGHIQATGRDARGRKQYRYHPRWRQTRDATKYHRMLLFGQTLPRIRRRVRKDLARTGLPRAKVLAAVVRLLETTLIRVGNEEYTRQNGSFGLTTLRDRHVEVRGATLRFEFRGKSGIRRAIDLNDRRLARIVKQCQELPGHELFQFLDDAGVRHPINSEDVNDYLRSISGQDFTAKDFRTWSGTVLALGALSEMKKAKTQAEARHNVVRAVEAVARRLGNTKAVCRKCYIHPAVLETYLDGSLAEGCRHTVPKPASGLGHEEAQLLALLAKHPTRPCRRP